MTLAETCPGQAIAFGGNVATFGGSEVLLPSAPGRYLVSWCVRVEPEWLRMEACGGHGDIPPGDLAMRQVSSSAIVRSKKERAAELARTGEEWVYPLAMVTVEGGKVAAVRDER